MLASILLLLLPSLTQAQPLDLPQVTYVPTDNLQARDVIDRWVSASLTMQSNAICPQGYTRFSTAEFDFLAVQTSDLNVQFKVYNRLNAMRIVALDAVVGPMAYFSFTIRGYGPAQSPGWTDKQARYCCRPYARLKFSVNMQTSVLFFNENDVTVHVECKFDPDPSSFCHTHHLEPRYECYQQWQQISVKTAQIADKPAILVYPIAARAVADCPIDGPSFTEQAFFKLAVIKHGKFEGFISYDRAFVGDMAKVGLVARDGIIEMGITFAVDGIGERQSWPDRTRQACCRPAFRSQIWLGLNAPMFRYSLTAESSRFDNICYPGQLAVAPEGCTQTEFVGRAPICSNLQPYVTLASGEEPVDPALLMPSR
ncbi:uncharacterized protein L969DRAFT_90819 [Mixia osmundae IAM 14324]|uniref:Uncharacterized protein n=1 Tax=Mixia osmundae (strain CBS 9802 / IAM 14324 / JCM 22182 / KY 12970) TaxID=764103 RepID=G7DVZ9_MIXOS|nr:uncharacterized protein L969DRAFT_90819 [Mixia osmundae IAM 14324]KEI36495.1 hypothetical protein L969DRAFT_90819 [Mixia osmundae IAM 14324]GAA94805.1 hypothetical protein E5Q_01459 [Mixia osmundae IAM 14324]